MVKINGEEWSAFSDEPIDKDEEIAVESLKGVKVKVIKKEK